VLDTTRGAPAWHAQEAATFLDARGLLSGAAAAQLAPEGALALGAHTAGAAPADEAAQRSLAVEPGRKTCLCPQ
jgi:hypothetical protein